MICWERRPTLRNFREASNRVLLMTGRGIKLTAAQATVVAASLALVSAGIGGVIQGWANLKLERQKFEFSVIQKTIELPNREDQIRNLKFYLNAGFLSDPDGKIGKMEDSELPSSTPTLLGGVPSSLTEWPWLVSVFSVGRFICNGTLIAPRMVLTTALCVGGGEPSNYTVVTATDDGKYFRIGRRIPVTRIDAHPAFSEDTFKNDIAILELGSALPPPFVTLSGRKSRDQKVGVLTLVGTFDFRSELGKLTQSPIQIADDATCAQRFRGHFEPEGSICAGFEGGGFSACPGSGSAGAPLVVFDGTSRKYQIGIVSLADECRPGALYGVYTRLSLYADWIKQIVPDVHIDPMTEVKQQN